MQSHFWQKSLKVLRDRLFASVVSKKKKAEATGRPFTPFLTFGRRGVPSLRTIAKSRCPRGLLLHPQGPSYFTHLVNGWKEARHAGVQVSSEMDFSCNKEDARKRNVGWAAKRIFKSRPPTLKHLKCRPIRYIYCERVDTRLMSAKCAEAYCHFDFAP